MNLVLFLVPFVLAGIAVVLIAFSGGPSKAREAYLTRGNRGFRIAIVAIYVGAGIVLPLVIIAARGEAIGAGRLAGTPPANPSIERGKTLFRQTCASCHSLAAVNARGNTGPSLDDIGELTPDRVLAAIENGGTDQGLMPKELLEGENAQAVADYLASAAGKSR